MHLNILCILFTLYLSIFIGYKVAIAPAEPPLCPAILNLSSVDA
ncbi:hypothetical protein [Pseudomonas sp. FEN]|nr:hypothetical protein [Pseudomonas sp. FEN]